MTPSERETFLAWLDQQISDRAILLEQMARVNAATAMIGMYRAESLALRVVAQIIRSTTTETT